MHKSNEYNVSTNISTTLFRCSLITGYPVLATCMAIFREE